MDRRELLAKGIQATTALAFANLVNTTMLGQEPSSLPTISWLESPTSRSTLARMMPLLEKANRSKGLHCLTANEWDLLASTHGAYFYEHHKSGDLQRIDVAIKAHEAYLKTKYNHDAVNNIVEYGTYNLLASVPAGFRQVAEKLRQEPLSNMALLSCGGFWSTMAATALIITVFAPEAEPVLVLLGIYYWIMDVMFCP